MRKISREQQETLRRQLRAAVFVEPNLSHICLRDTKSGLILPTRSRHIIYDTINQIMNCRVAPNMTTQQFANTLSNQSIFGKNMPFYSPLLDNIISNTCHTCGANAKTYSMCCVMLCIDCLNSIVTIIKNPTDVIQSDTPRGDILTICGHFVILKNRHHRYETFEADNLTNYFNNDPQISYMTIFRTAISTICSMCMNENNSLCVNCHQYVQDYHTVLFNTYKFAIIIFPIRDIAKYVAKMAII